MRGMAQQAMSSMRWKQTVHSAQDSPLSFIKVHHQPDSNFPQWDPPIHYLLKIERQPAMR